MEIVQRRVPASQLDTPSDLLRRIYAARGITDPRQLQRSLGALLTPGQLPDIDRAAERLADAVQQQQHILIIGDFDADGATAVALCMLLLRAMGAQSVDYLVPNRFEYGYGLSPEIVALAEQQTPQVIVTVDNGISSVAGVQRAQQAGIDVIVTDHHLPGAQLPQAYAIVNPNCHGSGFASPHLAGVGVAYYVISQLRAVLRKRGWFDAGISEPNLARYLDLVALGTIADVVPLDSNNRVLVHQGVSRMRAGKCLPGIKALAEIAKRPLANLTSQDLGFALGPRLNAAGRLEDMSIGIKCLLADDLSQARKLARMLDELNKTRRQLEQEMVSDAELILAEQAAEDPAVGLVAYHESFHQGVVGIVAGRLREKFHKPAIAFADAGDAAPDELKGSARSINGLHIRDVLDGMATQHPGLLIKFGGHAMAAGLSIKRVHLPRFKVIFDKAVRAVTHSDMLAARLVTDGSLGPEDFTLETAQLLAAGGPWGNGFPEPSFVGEFELVSQRVVGQQHLKMVFKLDHQVVDAIAFRQPPLSAPCARVQAVFRLDVNHYGEWPTVQLVVEYLTGLP